MAMVEEIHKKIWELSPHVQCQDSYFELLKMTDELINLYNDQGRLSTDPFSPVRERSLNLSFEKINEELKNSTCIVTGGLGCVGSILVNELLKFDVKKIIIIDINQDNETFAGIARVNSHYCDIRNPDEIRNVFLQYHPDFVFHTAAKRNPGYAESNVVEAVRTNVFGTLNIVKACEAIGTVKQMIFTSTGKASRYLTSEIYAATKKLCEYILDTQAKQSKVKFTLVRFTHILDNSLMNNDIEQASNYNDYVAIHSPGKYVIAQNALEAAHLMLNALIFSTELQCQFLCVRNLEWPVESLEMALYHIKKSRRMIPVIFLGNPIGYSEKFFRGQMDWSQPDDLNLLINVYEKEYQKLNPTQDIIISRISSPNGAMLEVVLDRLENATGEKETRSLLIEGLKNLAKEIFKNSNEEKTINILEWGLEPQFLESEHINASDYGAVVPLLLGSLEGSKYFQEAEDLVYLNDLI